MIDNMMSGSNFKVTHEDLFIKSMKSLVQCSEDDIAAVVALISSVSFMVPSLSIHIQVWDIMCQCAILHNIECGVRIL